MTFEIIFVLLALVGMVIALILDKMRPGMVLFSVVVLFLCAGILTPKEMLEGFSNKGMMCGHCEATVKKALEALPEVTSAEVSHEAGTAVVTLSSEVADDVLKKTVEEKDYKVTAID